MKLLLATCFTLPALILSTPVLAADHNHNHSHNHSHHPHMDAEVKAFHQILSPLWHGGTGAARAEKSCKQADTLLAAAAKIKTGGELVKALEEFKVACQSKPLDADGALSLAHDAFHKLIGH